MSLIKFHEVSYRNILHKISGTFNENCITTFVGPSGAGKTTCLKHINALISPDAGDVYFQGENIKELDVIELRQNIGMAFQSAPMISGTVYDNLNLPKDVLHETLSTEEARRLLTLVDLNEDFLTRPVNRLSGGEKSRISLARTFVNHPKVLLLDEVTASLDYTLVREIEKLIVRIQRELNVTIIWITHDLEQARRVSDAMWFLKEGRLLQQGTVSEIEHSSHPEIQNFLKGEK